MKSLMLPLRALLSDAEKRCATSTTRDLETITRRVKHEGLSFLTIALPNFSRDFERCLEIGYVDRTFFQGFVKPRKRALPAFLSGLLGQVFDKYTGILHQDPSVEAIFCIRTITRFFGKMKLQCDESRTRAAFKQFLDVDAEVALVNEKIMNGAIPGLHQFGLVSDLLWSHVLTPLDASLYRFEHEPFHGPGATSERVQANGKFSFKIWHSRLDQYFPYDRFAVPTVSSIQDGYGPSDIREPDTEQPVRVISVPKTQKTPRIIAIEPVCMQACQQSVLRKLVPLLENNTIIGGSLGFTDQNANRDLARAGSSQGGYATLDLSEASDRVASALVDRMLRSVPHFRGAVFACRSSRADVPGHGIHSLAKYASMGSALCFPIEAMVFLTIILTGQLSAEGIRPTVRDIKRICRQVRIYGDDIIIPVDMVDTAICYLEAFGLKVNKHKSFWSGKFRESCGGDYYDGFSVKPVYCRTLPPTSRRDAESIVSWNDLANQLYHNGLWGTCQVIRDYIDKLVGYVPYASDASGYISKSSFLQRRDFSKWNRNLHRYEVVAPVLVPKKRVSPLDGYGALFKYFMLKDTSILSPDHLTRYGRPVSVSIKRRWVPAS